MARLDVDGYIAVAYLLAAKKAAETQGLTLYEVLEAAAIGQVQDLMPGGRMVTGTSSAGTSVSFALPVSGADISPGKVTALYVALRVYCRDVAAGLSLDAGDTANDAAIADGIEDCLLDTEPDAPDFSGYRE